jgi:hypothetical protein
MEQKSAEQVEAERVAANAKELEDRARIRQQLNDVRKRRRSAIRRSVEQAIGSATSEVTRAAFAMGGSGLVAYGAWLAWAPAGYVVGGVLMLTGVWLHDRNG